MRTAIVQRPIDSCALLAEVAENHNGASVLFVGTVRDVNEGSPVSGLDYSAYTGMAEKELADITTEAADRWKSQDIVVEHRVGTLELGEASVVIAVAHPHRAEAYEASRFIIEELKKRLPIWKREHYVDGRSEWVEAATGAHETTAARAPGARDAGVENAR
jgi:molybdopterin synthase catalytic subunit